MHNRPKRYRVCILECRDTSLFTALTSAAAERCVAAHNASDDVDSYTKGRRPVRLIHSVDAGTDRCSAIGLTLAMRRLSRRNKLKLIAGDATILARVFAEGDKGGNALRENFRRANKNLEPTRNTAPLK